MKIVTVLMMSGILLAVNACAESGAVLFEDNFEGTLAEGWTWLREDKADWRIKDDGLEIRPRPGDANSVKNALLRTLPENDVVVEVTVTFTTDLTQQYEQAGITWYADDAPVFKLVHERIDDAYYIIPGKVPVANKMVHLRLTVIDGNYTAEFCVAGEKDWKVAAKGDMEIGKKNQVSLQTYHGPADGDHWMRFSNFKIKEVG